MADSPLIIKSKEFALQIIKVCNDVHYTPYIGYLFVDEKWRGNRLSQRLIIYSMSYLKSVGFDKVYLVSDHENLYEKYGLLRFFFKLCVKSKVGYKKAKR